MLIKTSIPIETTHALMFAYSCNSKLETDPGSTLNR